MKPIGWILSALLISLTAVALAQPEAENSFEKLKTLAGTWEGPVTSAPSEPTVEGKTATITLRVTSMGNALLHEMKIPGRPDDPITMLYLNDGQLNLTHYCDAGNRPHMTGKLGPDGHTFTFDMIDITGSTEHGHMHGVAFNVLGPDHHTEEWTFMVPGQGPVHAHFDLHRKS